MRKEVQCPDEWEEDGDCSRGRASRGVSYASKSHFPSPLDYDFFDLLQRLSPRKDDRRAVQSALEDVAALPRDYWRSFERAFYTLQLRAYLSEKLKMEGSYKRDDRVVADFALCMHALLREAHGRKTKCDYHESIVSALDAEDSVISFNYDLVVERALKRIAESQSIKFGKWLYGFETRRPSHRLPLLLKLHGSSNWRLNPSGTKTSKDFEVRTKEWKNFDKAPGYARITETGNRSLPHFLAFLG